MFLVSMLCNVQWLMLCNDILEHTYKMREGRTNYKLFWPFVTFHEVIYFSAICQNLNNIMFPIEKVLILKCQYLYGYSDLFKSVYRNQVIKYLNLYRLLKQPNQHWTHFSNYCKYLFCKAHISNYFKKSSSTVCDLFLSSLHCILRHPTFFNEYHIKKQYHNDLLCISLIRTRISGKNKRFDPLAYVFIHKFMSLHVHQYKSEVNYFHWIEFILFHRSAKLDCNSTQSSNAQNICNLLIALNKLQ